MGAKRHISWCLASLKAARCLEPLPVRVNLRNESELAAKEVPRPYSDGVELGFRGSVEHIESTKRVQPRYLVDYAG